MAKVIRATPTLVGKEAVLFLERMKSNNNRHANRKEKELFEIVKENQKFFSSRVR